MFNKCMRCEVNYTEEDEVLCLNCGMWESYEIDHAFNLENESVIEEYGDNEFLNQLGVSFNNRQ